MALKLKLTNHCTTLSDKVSHLKLQLINAQNFHASSEVQPWLDDLIGKANEVLNALLRIRKYQMAEEYQQAQYNEERQRKRGVGATLVKYLKLQNGAVDQMGRGLSATHVDYIMPNWCANEQQLALRHPPSPPHLRKDHHHQHQLTKIQREKK
ncbi:hypothetical protein DFQ28_000450 [Apophysomyces sp. BC1034]|nr:hypothetical protein DFQ28_000450 [Apophysomyces sp. BC1034]